MRDVNRLTIEDMLNMICDEYINSGYDPEYRFYFSEYVKNSGYVVKFNIKSLKYNYRKFISENKEILPVVQQ
jgi:hypothetical protein